MQNIKKKKFFSLLNSYLIDSPQPVNISYLWNFGSLLGVCLVIQIITGITLAIHYTSYLDANTASFFFLFVSQIELKYINIKTKVKNYVNYFGGDFVKGIKHASSFPLLPSKVANYHNCLVGRTLRVIGGLSAYILLTSNTELALFDSLSNKDSFLFYLIAFLGLSHLFYMLTIFTIKLAYVIYHIFNGDWIHKNSPLKYIMTESSGVLFCVKGFCYVSAAWFTAVGVAVGLDEVVGDGENFFKELAVIKKPALFLKSSIITLNDSVYSGNSNSGVNSDPSLIKDTTISDSKILNKLTEKEKLIKLKSGIANNPEIKQVFENFKNEMQLERLKDIDQKHPSIKK